MAGRSPEGDAVRKGLLPVGESDMKLRGGILAMLTLIGLALAGAVFLAELPWGPSPARSAEAPERSQPGQVERVVDGDTLVIMVDGVEQRVRLLGIDTPELPRDDRYGEYLAQEAASFTRELVLGKRVLLSGDPRRKDRDEYGRLLRYVRLHDGRLLNAQLLRRGYAHVFARYPFERLDEFLTAQDRAREEGLGLWADGGLAEIQWNLAHGVRPVRLYPTSDRRWAIEYGEWIKPFVRSPDLARELGRLRRSAEPSDRRALSAFLQERGYRPVPAQSDPAPAPPGESDTR
jgi:micrococcal nuclease